MEFLLFSCKVLREDLFQRMTFHKFMTTLTLTILADKKPISAQEKLSKMMREYGFHNLS